MTTSSQAAVDHWVPDPDFGGRRVHIREWNRPTGESDDEVTGQTIGLMHQLAYQDARNPAITDAAAAAVDLSPGPRTPRSLTDAFFGYAKATVTYTHETDMQTPFSDLLRYQYDQTLITPAALIAMPRPAGDCVDFAMLVAAMCHAYGIPAAFKTIAADAKHPEVYSHVYVVAQLAPGIFYALDASNGPAPGAEFNLPRGRKARIWPNPYDLTRNPEMLYQSAQPARRPQLLSNFRRRRAAARLGDVSEDGVPIYDGLPPGNPTTYEQPSGGSGWTKILTTVVDDATRIAAPLIRQANIKAPYYIEGANGAQILYDPSTGKTANAGAASQRTPAVISQNLLIGGAVLAAVFVAISASTGKR